MKRVFAGAHVSIAGGIYRAFERGDALGCRSIQIFLKNSNQWRGKPLTDEDCALFIEARAATAIHPVIAHDSYLINLASPDRGLFRKSFDAFVDELRRANRLGVSFLVMHPGAHMGSGESAGIGRIARALRRALAEVEPPVVILLENTAGQGSCLGHRVEHLAAVIERIGEKLGASNRVGVCIDTCHLFAAGYDIRTAETYEKTMWEFDRLIGLDRIRLFHVNDSRRELGSRVDRHSHIGQGFIGLEAFRLLLNDSRFEAVPKIIETPKGKGIEDDLMNLATLTSLVRVEN